MDFVKKCKRVWGSNKRLYPEESESGSVSGSYGILSEKCHKKKKDMNNKKPPHGCLCVYVGPERQRFVIKIKVLNHPLFKTLLEDVENEYGYRTDGPLWLPCDVDLFCETLVNIERDGGTLVIDDGGVSMNLSPEMTDLDNHRNFNAAVACGRDQCPTNHDTVMIRECITMVRGSVHKIAGIVGGRRERE